MSQSRDSVEVELSRGDLAREERPPKDSFLSSLFMLLSHSGRSERWVCRPQVSRAGHRVPMDDSRHPPPRNSSLLLSRINRGLTQAPVACHSQPTQAQAGDSALNIAHEPRPQPQPCRQNGPCAMLSQGLPRGAPTLRRASMFLPQARQRSQEGLYRWFHQLSKCEKCWLGPQAVYSPLSIC